MSVTIWNNILSNADNKHLDLFNSIFQKTWTTTTENVEMVCFLVLLRIFAPAANMWTQQDANSMNTNQSIS